MKRLLFGITVFVALVLHADTVVWYHLDDKAPGKQHANNGVVVNAAATGEKFNGTATVYNGSNRSGDSWLLPLGVDSLPTGWRFFDPVTQTTYDGNSALRLKANNNNQSSWVGVVEVPYGEELDATGDFTIEIFFKYIDIATDTPPTIEQTLVCRRVSESNGNSAIELALAGNGRAICRYSYLGENDAVVSETKYVATIQYNDHRWHHAALTYTKSTRTVRLYVDRSLQAVHVLPGALYPTTQPLFLGVNPSRGWGGACENVDEFRYSNAALAPTQFIRAVGGDSLPLLPETVIYQRFGGADGDSVGGGTTQYGCIYRNEAFGEQTYGSPDIVGLNGTTPATSDACASSLFMTNALLGTKFVNDGATQVRATAASKSTKLRSHSWTWSHGPAKLSDGDFTYECLFRMPKGCPTDQQYFASEKTSWYLAVSGGNVHFRWDRVSNKRVDDGRWHQVAVVHELATKTVRVYLDYSLVKTWSGEGSKGDLGHTGDGTLTFGGYETPHYNETWADVDLDEIRVTRKALALDEMLHPGDGVTICDLDLADAYGWESGRFTFSPLDVSKASHAYSNEVPYAITHAGIEADGVANERSFFFNKTQASGGILLPDPEIALPRDSFTAEIVFKVDPNACDSFKNDCVYLFCQSGAFYVRYNRTGTIRFCDSAWVTLHEVPRAQVDDGNWHHLAFVQDRDNGELRAYFDYREVVRKTGSLAIPTADASKTLFVNCGCWNNTAEYSSGPMLFNRLRVVRKALRPTEFVTSRALEGDLLHWAGFENAGGIVPDYGFGVNAAVAQYAAGAGKLTDAAGEVVRTNRRSASATGFQFSNNALLERADQSVEFFLRADSAADGTDLVSFRGATADKPIWALRKTAAGLKVVVTTAAGVVTEVASAGELPGGWTHFALVFVPGETSTAVKVYRNYALADEGSFADTLQVDGLPTSALSVGSFAGRVDELRVFRGALAVEDMLHATPQGLFFVVQ